MLVLLVEDNISIAKGLTYTLRQNNYDVYNTYNVKDTVNYIDSNRVDLIILDVSLPDGDGFTLYNDYIKAKNIKTIFLTAKDSEDDIVKGLGLGAFDYITKPFRTRELLARIKRLYVSSIKVKDIVFDIDKMEVYKNDKLVNLTSLELKILYMLFTNLNKVVTRNSLIEYIWNITGNDIEDNTITVYLKRIREKLGSDIIKTVKGIGYRVDE